MCYKKTLTLQYVNSESALTSIESNINLFKTSKTQIINFQAQANAIKKSGIRISAPEGQLSMFGPLSFHFQILHTKLDKNISLFFLPFLYLV